MEEYLAAVRRAAQVIDVPGAPLTLRLDDARIVAGRARLSWSFEDPESYEGDPVPHGRRVTGELDAGPPRGDPAELGHAWWSTAQLDAAHRFRLQVDADWLPGVPYVETSWTVDEAWSALLSALAAHGAVVEVDGDEIHVVSEHETVSYRLDPEEWATYLNGPAQADPPDDSYVVPAAVPLSGGLPLWAVDELDEATGSSSGVVGLVDGELGDVAPET